MTRWHVEDATPAPGWWVVDTQAGRPGSPSVQHLAMTPRKELADSMAAEMNQLQPVARAYQCSACGTLLEGDLAEVYDPANPTERSQVVHAEPCALGLLQMGWGLA